MVSVERSGGIHDFLGPNDDVRIAVKPGYIDEGWGGFSSGSSGLYRMYVALAPTYKIPDHKKRR